MTDGSDCKWVKRLNPNKRRRNKNVLVNACGVAGSDAIRN